MNERIKQVRKYYGLTQNEFGERIGVRGNTITGYENGLRSPSNAIIIAIAKEYNISESWLRTGEGEMLNENVASGSKSETTGERLRVLRLSLGVTQEQFGETIGVKGNTVAQWESSRNAIPESVIRLICNQYQINKGWLQTGAGEMSNNNDSKAKTPGERLRILRARFGLTQRELADRIRVKRNTVGQWECGINAMTDQMIFLICKEFCVNEDWLRTGDGNMLAYDSAPEIGERVKQARLSLDLTQAKFGAGIGLKQNSIALIERGDRNLSNQAIISICREYGINESWLRTGEGKMMSGNNEESDTVAMFENDSADGIENRIKQVRIDCGLSQADMAVTLNLSENFVWMMENGKRFPGDRTIADICSAFGVNEAWLRTGEGEMFSGAPRQTAGDRVRSLRTRLGMTLDKFSEQVGMSKAAISNVERGERVLTKQLATSISREFDVDRGWLLSGAGESHVPDDDRLDSLIVSLNEQILGLDRGKAILAVEIMQRLLLLLK